jgi:hypothetical protein
MADSSGTSVRDILKDAFGRIDELVRSATDGLTEDVANYRPDESANSIGWLIWHTSRIQDSHIADAAGTEQVWVSQGWVDHFSLPFAWDATGYGQDAKEVGAVQVPRELLAGYYADVADASARYLDGLTDAELGRVIDTNWDPPVTVAVRLVSVLSDCLQHMGQAAYVRGLIDRA